MKQRSPFTKIQCNCSDVKIENIANFKEVKMVTLAAKNLNFEDVHHLLGFHESGEMGIFSDYLDLESISDFEQTELT
ncbi:MAG: hypothetical protein ACK45T_13655, partial [Pseudanabaena sp.]